MADSPSVADDIAQIDRWLASSDAGFGELRGDLDFLCSPEQTRRYLLGLREGLEAVRDGRVVPHAQIVSDMQERHRRHRPHAAE